MANSIPDGAEIYVDSKPVLDSLGRVAITPVTILNVPTGIHKVTFRKSGYIDENVEVIIENGLYSDASAILTQMTLNISQQYEMQPKLPRHKRRESRRGLILTEHAISSNVSINSSPPGAYIYIDGVPLVDNNGHAILTPVTVTGIAEGLHEIILSLDGYYDKQIIIDISSNKINNVFAVLQPI